MTADRDDGSDEVRGRPGAGKGGPDPGRPPAPRHPKEDPILQRVGETSLRMMSGAVSGACVRKCRELCYGSPEVYPWEAVVEAVLADPVDPTELANKGILAQRNWILRGGAGPEPGRGPRRKRTVRVAAKTLLAMAIVRGAFYGFFAFAVLVLLLLLKARWPGADIYRILDWLREVLPGLFGAG